MEFSVCTCVQVVDMSQAASEFVDFVLISGDKGALLAQLTEIEAREDTAKRFGVCPNLRKGV